MRTVSASVALAGVSAASFTTALQTAFVTGTAANLAVPIANVSITSFADTPAAGRRLLASSLTVQYAVATPSPAAASLVTNKLADSTNAAALTTALQTAGVTGLTGATVDPNSITTTSKAQAAALAVSAAPSSSTAAALPVLALLAAVVAVSF